MANTKITLGNIADDAVGLDQLNISNSPSDGQALTYDGNSTNLQWATISGTTINNNADNRVITGSGTANTLNGESSFTFDGTKVGIGTSSGAGKLTNYTSANRQQSFQGANGDLDIISDNNSAPVVYIKGTGTADLLNVFDNTTEVFSIQDGGQVLIGQDSGDAFNDDSMLRIQRTGDRVFQQFKCDADQNVQILFGDVDDDVECSIQYHPSDQDLRFTTGNNSEAFRIDSSGRMLVGWTSSLSSSATLQVNSNAKIGNLFFQGDSTNSKLIAGNAEIRLSSLEFRGGGSGLDFDVTLIKTGVGFTNMFKVDSPSGDTFTNDGTISSLSDERIKTDINDLADGLDIVKQLRPVTFKYNDTTEDEEGKKELGTADDTVRYGFIAQEVEAVAPQYVETSTRKINNVEVDDFKSMSTTRMIPMLFKAIQEQQAIIDDLKTRIETLESN